MLHTLEQIKTDLSSRLTSEEYLPDFISRDGDLTIFADSMAEFVAPYAKQLEDIENLYNDVDILRNYLLSKGLYL